MEFGKIDFGVGQYLGLINEGKAYGYGRIIFNNGDIYLGEFRDNSMTGVGVKSTASYVTIGYFQNGKRLGHGCTFFRKDKAKYIGNYENDIERGQGAYLYGDGNVFVGSFSGGLPNGLGCYSHNSHLASGYLLQGYFSNGRFTGSGANYSKITFGDGSIFYGPGFAEYDGFGEFIDAYPKAVRQIGYHYEGKYASDVRFKGVRILGDRMSYGDKTMTRNDGCYSKVSDKGELYIGDFIDDAATRKGMLAKFDNNGVYSLYIGGINGKWGKGSYGVEVTRGRLVVGKGKYEFGNLNDGFECYENGVYKKIVGLSYGKSTSAESDLTLNCYKGTLNGGSVFVGYSAPNQTGAPKTENASQTNKVSIDFGSTIEKPQGIGSSSVNWGGNVSAMPTAQTSQVQVTPQVKEKKPNKLATAVKGFLTKFKKEEPQVQQKQKSKRESYVRTIDPYVEKLYKDYGFLQGSSRTVLNKVKWKTAKHEIPREVKRITAAAFAMDKTVKEIIFNPESTIELDIGAFEDCKNLEKVDFSAVKLCNAKKIFQEDVFNGCINLKTVILPNTEGATAGDKRIVHEDAFLNCDYVKFVDNFLKKTYSKEEFLKEYLVPQTVLSKKQQEEKEKIKEIKEKINVLKEENGFVIKNENGLITLVNVGKSFERIIVPEGVERIRKAAYVRSREKAKEIIFPSTLKEIEGEAFKNFKNLERVDLSKTQIVTLENNLFDCCSSLKEVAFPKNLETIGNRAFKYSRIVEVELTNVKIVKDCAFYSCPLLQKVFLPKAEKIGFCAFNFCKKLEGIVVGKDISGIHKNAFGYDMKKTVTRRGEYKLITATDYKRSAISKWLDDKKWEKEQKNKN